MLISASPPRANPNDSSPVTNPVSDALHSNTDPAGFASLLRQSQVASTALAGGAGLNALRPMPEPAPATIKANEHEAPHPEEAAAKHDEPAAANKSAESTASTDDTASTVASTAAGAQARAVARAKLRSADGGTTRDTKTTDKGKTASTDTAADAETPASKSTATATGALDPNVMQWLASQQRPAVAEAVRKTGGNTDVATSTDTLEPPGSGATDALAALAGGIGGKHPLTPAELKAEAASAGRIGDDVGQRFAATLDTATAQAAAGDRTLADAIAGAAAMPKLSAETMAAAAAAQLVGSTNEITATAAPTAVAIATPVEAPDFGQALGLQLSVLARDGVHEAELHLNPADMGPVSVQIVMDGTQARIDFGADVAATRQAIEAGLPALASALRDAGFTLAGGGVSQQSQQSQQRGDGSNADSRRGARGGVGADGIRSIDAAARAASTPRRVALGAVDTYA
jgi:flagellar hook-length control protein FliK